MKNKKKRLNYWQKKKKKKKGMGKGLKLFTATEHLFKSKPLGKGTIKVEDVEWQTKYTNWEGDLL